MLGISYARLLHPRFGRSRDAQHVFLPLLTGRLTSASVDREIAKRVDLAGLDGAKGGETVAVPS